MRRVGIAVIALSVALSGAVTAAISPELVTLRAEWAKVKYELPEEQREAAFEDLARQARHISDSKPGAAEPLIWEAIILASSAGENGGLGALSLVKQARELLLKAEEINATAMDGSVYTSLGSLYYQVPGWPLAFGDDDQARVYLEKALALNPDGIDANYFYGDFLMQQGDYAAAIIAFEKALQAPSRPDRPLADKGRRQEVQAALAEANNKL